MERRAVETVIYEKDGPIARIILNRPEKANAQNSPMVWDVGGCRSRGAGESVLRPRFGARVHVLIADVGHHFPRELSPTGIRANKDHVVVNDRLPSGNDRPGYTVQGQRRL